MFASSTVYVTFSLCEDVRPSPTFCIVYLYTFCKIANSYFTHI